MIEITIDNKTIRADENQTLLQAAKANGIDIPHLCYHPALKPSGSCKLCGVEVVSHSHKKVVVLSCVLKLKPGLEVKTSTDLVREARKKAMNRLLQMAPYSRRIKAIADKYNIETLPVPDGCIHCWLCVQVCNDVIHAGALKIEKTAAGSFVKAEPGKCIGCGSCANICPTDLIKVEDHDNIRTVSINNEIIGNLPLERCEACGQMFATSTFLNHVEISTGNHPHVKDHHRYCPNCVKLISVKARSSTSQTPRS